MYIKKLFHILVVVARTQTYHLLKFKELQNAMKNSFLCPLNTPVLLCPFPALPATRPGLQLHRPHKNPERIHFSPLTPHFLGGNS